MMKEKNELTALSEKIEKGLKISFEKLISFKRYKNTPLVFSRNGEIIKIYPKDFDSKLFGVKETNPYKRENKIQLVNEPQKITKKKKS